MAAASAGDNKLHTTPKGTAAAYDDDVIIRIRCSALDYKMERDPSPFDHRVSPYLPAGERLDAVPVLRIFGATDQGQRVVAHVHGAFPYVYVEYQGSLNPDTGEHGLRRSVDYQSSRYLIRSQRLHVQARPGSQSRSRPLAAALRGQEETYTPVHCLHPPLQGCTHLRLPGGLQDVPQDLLRQPSAQEGARRAAAGRRHHGH